MHYIFIHGTGGSPDEAFFPCCRTMLEKLGHQTSAPALPSPMEPDRKAWLQAVLDLYNPTEETAFIGRSLGGTLIPYLLERNDVNVKVAVSIAAPINHLDWDNLKSFFSKEPDFAKAKNSCVNYFHWYSDDDPHVPLAHGKQFQELLGGELRVFEGYSHFYNEEFPELIDILKNLD